MKRCASVCNKTSTSQLASCDSVTVSSRTWDVSLQGVIILGDGRLDRVIVTRHAGVLDLLCQLPQDAHVPGAQLVKSSEGLLLRLLPHHGSFQEAVQVLQASMQQSVQV